jgi:hypothetical protein
MAQATRDTTAHGHPPHVQIWEHPERASKIKKLGGTWLGHCCVHITHALNELPPEARATFLKDLGDHVRRQGQSVARRDRDRAAKRGRS